MCFLQFDLRTNEQSTFTCENLFCLNKQIQGFNKGLCTELHDYSWKKARNEPECSSRAAS